MGDDKNKGRPHKSNGNFASRDPEKAAASEITVIPPAPTDYDPPKTTGELCERDKDKSKDEPVYDKKGFLVVQNRITREKIVAKKFAQAVFNGATLKQAAITVTGVEKPDSANYGSSLMHNAEVQREFVRLIKLMESKDLGVERVLRELEKGLKNGKIGTHSDYLEKQMRLLGMIRKDSDSSADPKKNLFLFQQLVVEAESRGKRI